MREYVTDAVVLDRDPVADADSRVHLFTKKYGKLIAKAKSARKITSKLSGHLEPGMLAKVRLVEKNGLQVADALANGKISASLPDLHAIGMLLAETEPDSRLWRHLTADAFSWREVLALLGWDPARAACDRCDRVKPAVFVVGTQCFFCGSCASKLPKGELLLSIEAEQR